MELDLPRRANAGFLPTLNFDIIHLIFEVLQLPPAKLAPYRRCCRSMVQIVARLVRRFDASQLSRTLITEEGWVRGITTTYPHLEVLQLSGLLLSDEDTITFASNLRNLKEIDLFDSGVSDLSVCAVAERCPFLQSVTVGGSVRRNGAKITNVAIRSLAEHSSSLTGLHMASCFQLTDEALVDLCSKRGQGLRSVSLSKCAKLTDASLLGLANTAFQLESLNLNECYRLTNAGVVALAEKCRGLSAVNVRGTRVTDVALEALARMCPKLVDVNLESCLNLTDQGLIHFATRRLGSQHSSRDLHLTGPLVQAGLEQTGLAMRSAWAAPSRGLGEPGVEGDESNSGDEAVKLGSRGLEALSVAGCVRLTDVSIVSVAPTCPTLAKVDLSQVYDVTDASLCALAANCGPCLRSVKLSRCGRITDRGIIALARDCPSLAHLWVDDCHALTDASIVLLAPKCRKLQTLDLSHCPKLTDNSVLALTRYSRSLVRVSLRFPNISLVGPSLLTDRAVLALVKYAKTKAGRAKLEQVDLTGHPRLLSPAAAAAIASVTGERTLARQASGFDVPRSASGSDYGSETDCSDFSDAESADFSGSEYSDSEAETGLGGLRRLFPSEAAWARPPVVFLIDRPEEDDDEDLSTHASTGSSGGGGLVPSVGGPNSQLPSGWSVRPSPSVPPTGSLDGAVVAPIRMGLPLGLEGSGGARIGGFLIGAPPSASASQAANGYGGFLLGAPAKAPAAPRLRSSVMAVSPLAPPAPPPALSPTLPPAAPPATLRHASSRGSPPLKPPVEPPAADPAAEPAAEPAPSPRRRSGYLRGVVAAASSLSSTFSRLAVQGQAGAAAEGEAVTTKKQKK